MLTVRLGKSCGPRAKSNLGNENSLWFQSEVFFFLTKIYWAQPALYWSVPIFPLVTPELYMVVV